MDLVKKLQQAILPYFTNPDNYNEVMEIIYDCGNLIIKLEKELEHKKCIDTITKSFHNDCKQLGELEKDISSKEIKIKNLELQIQYLQSENNTLNHFITTYLQQAK